LKKRFGHTYLRYRHMTPFLFPCRKPLVLGVLGVPIGVWQGGRGSEMARLGLVSCVYLSISLLGLFLAAMLAYSPVPITEVALQKQLTGAIFGAICVLGILAGFSPLRCSRIFNFRRRSEASFMTDQIDSKGETLTFNGHHPTCGMFRSHVIRLGARMHCAGCTGLVTGAVIALAGCFVSFFLGWSVEGFGVVAFWLGFLATVCGLLQYNLPFSGGVIHLILNLVFVLGPTFLLIGLDTLKSNLVLNAYLLALTAYWIMARTILSWIEHRKTCTACSKETCRYSFSQKGLNV